MRQVLTGVVVHPTTQDMMLVENESCMVVLTSMREVSFILADDFVIDDVTPELIILSVKIDQLPSHSGYFDLFCKSVPRGAAHFITRLHCTRKFHTEPFRVR